jgi:hypothetical protein
MRTGFELVCARMMPGMASGVVESPASRSRREMWCMYFRPLRVVIELA